MLKESDSPTGRRRLPRVRVSSGREEGKLMRGDKREESGKANEKHSIYTCSRWIRR